ncbi:hypothetical protein [Pseudoalteromonas sp. GCY]|uniref:hypothetical protein n=1 Tax=Pseudoalteromonas sp. GCY TaxID=2003316 RepID=UPI001F3795C5|nr:hypothetical protein [Pseudoalteromonas sp. GCY]
MMKVKLTLVLSLAIAISAGVYVLSSETNSPMTSISQNTEIAPSLNYSPSESSTKIAVSSTQENKIKNDPLDSATQTEAVVQENITERAAQPLSLVSFNGQFINNNTQQESLYRSRLESFFRADTNEILKQMSLVEYSDLANNREAKLQTFIQTRLEAVHILDETFKCAARVCMLELVVGSDSNTDVLSNMSEFDKNYSFQSKQTNEYGETTFKGLYIATDDPSKLTLTD